MYYFKNRELNMRIRAILTGVASPIPFGHLHQLDQVGISNIIILLSAEELKKAYATKFILFDHTEPKTVIEHYQSHNSRSKIEIMNTESAITEEEKLNFYLKHAKDQYQLHLFLCKGSMPYLNEAISTKPPATESYTYSFLVPLYTSTTRKKLPLFQSPCSSNQVVNLLQQNAISCFCYKIAPFDLLNNQWLFNIFVELIGIRIKSHEKFTELSSKLNHIINDFNQNIIALEKAELNFENTHKKIYSTTSAPYTYTKWQHTKNVTYKENLDDNFSQLICALISLYAKLLPHQSLHDSINDKANNSLHFNFN